MRWWILLVVTVIWSTVSTQPTTVHNDEAPTNSECCPCTDQNAPGKIPRASMAVPDSDADAFDTSLAVTDQDASGTGARAALARVGECPCQLRDADPTGSASIFIPTAVRAVRPFVSDLEDHKEDVKPLLHPEVDLASSVLETLREATNEEYEDALARDAARSAVPAMDQDVAAEESRNIVTVIVNPKQTDDDIMTSASHVQETRCVNSPLGESKTLRTPALKTSNLLTDILSLPRSQTPNLRNLFDMDSNIAASNTNEKIMAPSNNFEIPKLRSALDLSNLFPKSQSAKTPDLFDKQLANEPMDTNIKAKVRIPNILNLIPKIDSTTPLRRDGKKDNNLDNESSTSNNIDRLSGFTDTQDLSEGKSGTNSIFRSPVIFKNAMHSNTDNFLNKDSHTSLLRPQIKIPNVRLQSKSHDTPGDLLNSILKGLEIPKISDLLSINNLKDDIKLTQNTDSQIDTNNPITTLETYKTEILDTIPEASMIEVKKVSSPKIQCINNDDIIKGEHMDSDDSFQREKVETLIIDNVSNPSEINTLSENESIMSDTLPNNDVTTFDDVQTGNDFASSNSFPKDDSTLVINNIDTDQESNESSDNADIENSFPINRDPDYKNTEFDYDSISDNTEDNMDIETSEDIFERDNTKYKDDKLHDENPRISSSLREILLERSDNIESPKIQKLDTFKSSKPDKLEIVARSEELDETSLGASILDCDKEKTENFNQLSMDELQKMSDSLLNQEKEPAKAVSEITEKPMPSTPNLVRGLEENLADTFPSETNTNRQLSNIGTEDTSCLSEPTTERDQENVKDEMTLSASETVESRNNLRSSLLPGIVQPSPSLFGNNFNLFNNHNPLNLGNIFDRPLPVLGFSNVFDRKQNYNFLNTASSDVNANQENDIRRGMSTLASTSNSRLALPALQPLEDINLDIFQLSPLTLSKGPLLTALPKLNLNKYKTRLALPETLDLKPVFLESAVGNKKGIIGASLTFGPEKKQTSFRTTDILGNSLINLPNLDNIRETMIDNAQNLLSTPLDLSSRNMFEDTLRSTQVLSDNLRVQADNAVKNWHKNLESTFNGARIPNSGLLGEPLHTSSLLETVARRHEDWGDKLKGIHTDLTDRLETFRNNVADQLPTLSSPMSRQSSNIVSQKPIRLTSKPRSKENVVKKTGAKPLGKFKFKTRSSSNKNKLGKMPTAASISTPKVVELPKFRSSLRETSRKKPTVGSPIVFPRDNKILNFFEKSRSTIGNNKNILGAAFKPKARENKVKITFSATTPRPSLKAKSAVKTPTLNLRAKPLQSKKPFSLTPSTPSRAFTLTRSKVKPFSDPNMSPSEVRPTVMKAPLRLPTRSQTSTDVGSPTFSIASTPRSVRILPNLKPKPLVPKKDMNRETLRNSEPYSKSSNPLITDRNTREGNSEATSFSINKPTLSWPKSVDNTFLTKVREALRARLADLSPKNVKSVDSKLLKTEVPQEVDMLRSASDNVDSVDSNSKLMEENTSYTCKMMCSKN